MEEISKFNEFGNRRGIYLFWNQINGKKYIGEALNFRKRMNGYNASIATQRINQNIIKAFVKYGLESFKFFILEEFPDTTQKKILLDREEFWIKFYQTTNPALGYNIRARGVDMPSYFKERCKAAAKRGKDNPSYGIPMKKETREKLSISLSGRVRTEQHKRNLSISLTGNKISEETRQKLSKARKGVPNLKNSKRVAQLNELTNEVIKIWPSVAEAARNLTNPITHKQLSPQLIGLCINKTEKKNYGGYSWRYLE